MKIIYTSKFEREYRKLPIEIKKEAEKKEEIFRKNPFNAELKTHKLSGRFRNFWSFSINYNFRIIFEFTDENIIYFYSIGNHRVYQ